MIQRIFSSLRNRILVGGLTTILLIGVVWLICGTIYLDRYQRSIENGRLIKSVHIAMLDMFRTENAVLLYDSRTPAFFRGAETPGLAKRETLLQNVLTNVTRFDEAFDQSADADLRQFQGDIDQHDKAFNELITALRQRKVQNAGLETRQRDSLERLEPVLRRLESRAYEAGERARTQLLNANLIILIVGFLVGGMLFGLFARSLADPIISLKRAAMSIGEGNLETRVEARSHDEIGVLGRSFNGMAENLQNINQQLRAASNTLAASANEIVASTTQVAASASQTAAAVTETTATVEQVKQTAQLSSQKAREVADSAQHSADVSATGNQSVMESIAGMERVREQMASIAESVINLSEQSQAIGDIINTVNDLAEQSNLLAVNAAIEAAKAGEQGKGFGVVAQEVKSLAEQSKQATKQVRSILNEIQKATSAAVMATEQGTKAVEAGLQQAEEAGHSIENLSHSIEDSAQAALQIAASSQEQLIGVDQVALAMNSIKDASAQNVASMRQLETAARDLSEVGQNLRKLVESSAAGERAARLDSSRL